MFHNKKHLHHVGKIFLTTALGVGDFDGVN